MKKVAFSEGIFGSITFDGGIFFHTSFLDEVMSSADGTGMSASSTMFPAAITMPPDGQSDAPDGEVKCPDRWSDVANRAMRYLDGKVKLSDESFEFYPSMIYFLLSAFKAFNSMSISFTLKPETFPTSLLFLPCIHPF